MSKIEQLIKEKCPNGVNYYNLNELVSISTGKLNANAMVEDGKYMFFTCDSKPFRIDKYAFDGEAILISGNGSQVGHLNYYCGKFNAYQRTYVLMNFKKIIGKVPDINLDKISVNIKYNKDEEKKYFEALINFGDIDTIHVPFKITEKREFMFYPFIYSSISKKENVLSNEDILLHYSDFIFAFVNSFLVKDMIYLMNIEEEIRCSEDNKGLSYVKKRIGDFEQ